MTVFGGDVILASDINALIAASSERPAGRMIQTVAQTGIVNNTMTPVTFTTEQFDTAGVHSTSVNTSRVTPTTAGIYRVMGSVSISGATDYTAAEVVVLVNGSAVAPAFRITPSATSNTLVLRATAYVECNGTTDYFEVGYRVARSGAGTSSTAVSSQFASVLEWELTRNPQ